MTTENSAREEPRIGCAAEIPFTKPSWMRAEPRATDGNLFCRSSHTYADLAAEAERRKQRKAARKAKHRKEAESRQEQSPKRRRVSDAGSKPHSQILKPVTKEPSDPAAATVPPENSVSLSQIRSNPEKPSSLIQDYELGLAEPEGQEGKKRKQAAQIIDLESDSGQTPEPEIATMQGHTGEGAWAPSPITLPETEPAGDEEFPELARRAREKARNKRLDKGLLSPSPANEVRHTGASGEAERHDKEASDSPTVHDPTLEILITSSIEKTQPLIVSRKLSQRLKDVRLAWIQRQGFTPELADAVFLTWRGKRLFDVMSCKSLGLSVNSSGVIRGHENLLGDEVGRLHMEAMTLEILEARKKAREDADRSEEQAKNPSSESLAKVEAQVKIILVGKDHDDFRLRVKSVMSRTATPRGFRADMVQSTTIYKIISAFRASNDIQPDKEVFLLFDGERLSPQCKIGETEISDMDKIEVYVK